MGTTFEAFDPTRTDDVEIGDFVAHVPCRICQEMFREIRLTQHYCGTCKRGFCHDHGMWYGAGNRQTPQCVVCWGKSNQP